MSRRFGRNQKRKLREQLAQSDIRAGRWMDKACDLELALCRARDEGREAVEAVSWLREALPRFTALLPPELFEVSAVQAAREFITLRHTTPALDFGMSSDPRELASAVISLFNVPVVRLAMQRDPVAGALHAELSHDGVRVAYAASGAALRAIPSHRVARQIARQVSEQLARELLAVIRAPGAADSLEF